MMYFKTIISSFLIFTGIKLLAQDTITIMQYNLLNYGNTTSYCSESNNSTHDKDENIRKVIEFAAPDIIAVNEFSKLQQMQTNFINNNLNIKGVNYWKSDNIINHAQSSIINHIFYNSNKLTLCKHNYIPANYRDVDVYVFYFNTTTLTMGDTTKLVYVSAHLKAGQSETDAAERNSTAQKIMNYLADNHIDDNVVLSGDLNMYGSSEPAYYNLTKSASYGNALLIDPISNADIGSWDNSSMANYHTQSTHSHKDCAAGGGLDDRFDLFLISDEVRFGNKGIRYVSGSYKVIGNDGCHFDMAVNDGYNYDVNDDIADALYIISDHLPVTIKITLNNPLGTDENMTNAKNLFAAPNPAKNHTTLHFNSLPQIVSFDIMNTTGLTVLSIKTYCRSGNNAFKIDTSSLPNGFYIVRMTNAKGQTAYCKIVVRR